MYWKGTVFFKNICLMACRYINIKEYRRGNQKWTIQRNWQHNKTEKIKTQIQHNMCWTPLYANKHK